MVIQNSYDIFISENEKSFVITKAKVASRQIQELYDPNNFSLNVNSKFLFEDIGMAPDDNIIDDIDESKKLYKRLTDIKSNKKDVLILYRDPFKRYISGVVEDIIVNIDSNNFNERFYLRKYINKYNIDPYSLFKEFDSNSHNRDFLLSDDYIGFTTDLLNDYFFWQISTTPVNSHHSSPYLVVLNSIMSSNLIDNNKIKLINIDDDRVDLYEILKNYGVDKYKIQGSAPNRKNQSNKTFFKHISELIHSNKFFIDLVDGIIGIDYYFYEQFETSKFNVLNK